MSHTDVQELRRSTAKSEIELYEDSEKQLPAVMTIQASHPLCATGDEETSKPQTTLQRLTARLARWGVETNGITPVLPEQRTDRRLYQMFFVWFSANLNILTLTAGTVGPAFYGLGIRASLLAILVVDVVTCTIPAFFAVLGPKLGMRGMVQARFSWGYYGALIPSTLVTVTLQGYLILNTIVGGQTLGSVSAHLNASLGIVIIALVTLAVVFSGSRVLHWYNTFIWIPNLVAFITMLGVSGKHLVESPLSNPTPVGASNIMTFGATLAASVVNWSPLTPDQGVYHDHTASALRIWTYTYSGLLLSSMPAHMLGAAFTAGAAFNPSWKAGLGNGNDIGGLIAAVLEPAGGFGKFLVVLLALTTPSQCAPSMYTACNSFMTLAPTFARIPRFFLAIASTAIIIPVAIVGSNTFYSIFSDILGFIGYWLAPYVAVVLVEHVLYRRMRWSCYDVFEAWDDPKHPNLAPSYCSVITFVVSVGFIVVCMDKAWWVGPIARAGTGDVGMLLGFILGIVVYAAVRWWSGRRLIAYT
ncbi:permease for cytosine/purines, uracil, thiamine, allantoin-domain-containing protein [Rhodofomes roseus]|uniref:Permease for cytosine/purines, uracil, thiamine, allantoin-domain-containing protein n=1 Tax=Rhodofomes roseus TaxID=34475 RepID=A0ABQ8K0E6_9APHY|nr:permease for cytosine/purines, uracil, thiamine, allantoin-domain-containing protein [Rhodofomes roseus]KAH9829590.1 permease for cytosine/purines, uracil, thiamine, allantoin-domain-containing protein [Rhodofomes roseus]